MKQPFISFVIPAHNEERHIGLCLRALHRNKGKFEIILVNDGSIDKTEEIARKAGCDKILSFSKGHSAAFARNRGAEKAAGEYIVFLDADQLVEENFMDKCIKFLKEGKIDGSDFLVYSYKPKTFIQHAWSAYRKAYPTMGFVHIVKRNVFMRLGFDEKIFYHEERDFRYRFDRKGFSYLKPSNETVYHIDPENVDEFIRQRKWQGKQAGLKFFLPCILPPTILIPFFKVLIGSKDPLNSFRWLFLDFFGRYISLYYRLRNIGKNF